MEEIKKELKKLNVRFYEDENDDNQIWVLSCSIGDNFYDYGEEEPPLKVKNKFNFLLTDSRVGIVRCCECCSCAGW